LSFGESSFLVWLCVEQLSCLARRFTVATALLLFSVIAETKLSTPPSTSQLLSPENPIGTRRTSLLLDQFISNVLLTSVNHVRPLAGPAALPSSLTQHKSQDSTRLLALLHHL
jgi:hypothetical protein